MGSMRGSRLVLVAVLLAAGCGSGPVETLPACTAGATHLTPEQAANAATIAAVGRRLGMPDHAVTVALATAFQESKLRNLHYGDRDSLGLFQQRPSQGWGTAEQVLTPRLAAATFYRRLVRVPGWRTAPVTQAAQAVQHSGFPAAYGQWEGDARTLARAFTGEVAAGFACRFKPVAVPDGIATVRAAATRELGVGRLDAPRGPAQTWAAASWLVAQAADHGLRTVSAAGQTWTADRGTWRPDPKAVRLTFA
jgi:hypothetical protein